MHQVLNKFFKIFLIVLVSLSLFSCDKKEYIRTYDYLKELAIKTGITLSDDDEGIFTSLIDYGVIDEIDKIFLEKNLTYNCMLDSLSKFTSDLSLKYNYKDNDYVLKKDALNAIDILLDNINNKEFDTEEEHVYKSEVKNNINDVSVGDIFYDDYSNSFKRLEEGNKVSDVSFDEVFKKLKISSSKELDLDDCEIVSDVGEVVEEYVDLDYDLLSSKKNVVEKDGYRISYKVVSGVIEFRVANNKDNYNKYVDFKLASIKPSFKWDYENNTVNEAYFKLDYKLSCEVGASKEKRNYYNLDTTKLNKDEILSSLANSFVKKNKDVDTKIHICTIKTPIKVFPLVSFDIDIFLRFNVKGKIDIVATMSNTHGFEIINNKFRLINDINNDIDFNVEASARAVSGVEFALSCVKYKLMNMEITAGAKASCKTTLHLFDNDGNMETVNSDIVYSDLNDIESDNIKTCADLSLNWILDLDLNTKDTLLYKLGMSRSKEILNDKNQILGNLTHIENGHFVKSCTRKSKNYSNKEISKIDVGKIVLEKYSVAVNINDTYNIPIKALPEGYTYKDLITYVDDDSIVSINSLNVKASKVGSTKITIETLDHKYSAFINVLVSTGK